MIEENDSFLLLLFDEIKSDEGSVIQSCLEINDISIRELNIGIEEIAKVVNQQMNTNYKGEKN
jgi:hypothetical protein